MPLKNKLEREELEFDNPVLANEIFGPQNANLDLVAKEAKARITSRGASLIMESDTEKLPVLCNFFLQLYGLGRQGVFLSGNDLARAVRMFVKDPSLRLGEIFKDAVFVQTPRKTVNARNMAQKRYLDALRANELVFSIGPAGTGKTYLAVAMAMSMLQQRRVKRIVLTRPAVEAGEKLGFLPGDLAEKVNPYLRPLYDALYDITPQAKVASMLETGVIEIAPLAFMRGRTLNDAFVILDEAQNTTREQMKMFLTRMGFGTRMVVTGDVTQIDLPYNSHELDSRSGLVQALSLLENIPGIAIHRFNKMDVVRHPLVGAIVGAYDNVEKTGKAD